MESSLFRGMWQGGVLVELLVVVWDLAPWPGIVLCPLHWELRVIAPDHQGSPFTDHLDLSLNVSYEQMAPLNVLDYNFS